MFRACVCACGKGQLALELGDQGRDLGAEDPIQHSGKVQQVHLARHFHSLCGCGKEYAFGVFGCLCLCSGGCVGGCGRERRRRAWIHGKSGACAQLPPKEDRKKSPVLSPPCSEDAYFVIPVCFGAILWGESKRTERTHTCSFTRALRDNGRPERDAHTPAQSRRCLRHPPAAP